MTQLPRRAQNRLAKEQAILAAALKVFWQNGYSGASVDEVAAKAGITKPTLYQYFASKEQLFTAMMLQKRDDMLQPFDPDAPGTMVEQLHAFAWHNADTEMRPDMLSLARLIIGEVQRFPEIGRACQASGPDKVLVGVMAYLEGRRADGMLAFDDAQLAARFATVAMADTNGLLRGQMVPARSLKGIVTAGMGMAPAQLALDPTDVLPAMPGVNDDTGDFHDDPLQLDAASIRRMPWSKPGYDLLVLSNFTGAAAVICPRALLRKVMDRAGAAGLAPKYGMELEYTLFDETPESARAKGYRNFKTATMHPSHDLILYQVVQTGWYEAVAEICDPLGIDLAKMPEEIGSGLMEACIGAGEGTEPADQLVLLKNFIRALALRQGRMPRWIEETDSQSIHLHVSLKDKTGAALFHNPAERHAMSQTFKHFLGGLQTYIGDLSLIFLPGVNSCHCFAPAPSPLRA